MAFAVRPHENILFPVPFAENEEHPVIITNLRVMHESPTGSVEMPTAEVQTVSRQMKRPRAQLGVTVLALAFPLAMAGAYLLYSVWGMDMASPLSLITSAANNEEGAAPPPRQPINADGSPGDAPPSDAPETVNWPRTVLFTRAGAVACFLAALGCLIVARRLVRQKQYFVVCRSAKGIIRIEAESEVQQTQIMVTVSTVKGKGTAAKA